MELSRPNKRRKLDGPNDLTPKATATSRLAEMRRARASKRTSTAATKSPEIPESPPYVPARLGGDVKDDAQTDQNGGVIQGAVEEQASSAVKVRQTRSRRSTIDGVAADMHMDIDNPQLNTQREANTDVDMDDSAGEPINEVPDTIQVLPPSSPTKLQHDRRSHDGQNSTQLEDEIQVRTSGRERRKSRKVQEAQEVIVVTTPSSARRKGGKNTGTEDTVGKGGKSTPTGTEGTPMKGGRSTGNENTPGIENRRKRGTLAKTATPQSTRKTEVELSPVDAEPDTVEEMDVDSRVSPVVQSRTPAKSTARNEASAPEPGYSPPDHAAIVRKPKNTPKDGTVKSTKPRLNGLVSDKPETNGVISHTTRDAQPIPLPHLKRIQHAVLNQLTGRAPAGIIGLDDEYTNVANLVEQTISAGESNSIILIGPRGSGKSAVVDRILREQAAEKQDDFHVVRLSGFIHTDDKIALREIWRQLGKEMQVEEENLVKNYADTLTTLLALLSHPSELGLQEGHAAKSVIFVLDEFDLFTTHPRQTLLYNLFDIAQSRKAPIAVLGLTTRYDVSESLEKRVKSRFSHRQVLFPLAKNITVFRDICRSVLSVDASDLTMVGDLTSQLQLSKADDIKSSLVAWNAAMESLFESSTELASRLRRVYYTTKSVPDFQTSMLLPIAALSNVSADANTSISFSDLLDHLNTSISTTSSLSPPDSRLSLLHSLSTIQLALLIAAARVTIIHDTDTLSFGLAFDEYKSLASKARISASAAGAIAAGTTSRVWGVPVAKRAWEGLLELGFVMLVSEARGGAGLVRVDVALEEIRDSGVELVGGMGRWVKEI